MPDSIVRYFWLFFIVVMLVNVAIWRHRLRQLEALGGVSRAEADRFLRGAAVAIVAFGLASELVLALSGWPQPQCVLTGPLTTPATLATAAVNLVAWALLLRWVWVGQGAQTLARVGPALFTQGRVTKREYSVAVVRAAVTGFVALSFIGGVVWRLGGVAQRAC
jgi:hypothetical protein